MQLIAIATKTKLKILNLLYLICLIPLLAILLAGCRSSSVSELRVVTSTSLIAQIAERVAGDRVSVSNIIPPAQCPGHFDVKPSDMQMLAEADIFFFHGWQGEKFSTELIASAGNKNLQVVQLNIQGNWMTPSVQTEAAQFIATALTEADSRHAEEYKQSLAQYQEKISSKEAEIRQKLAGEDFANTNVLCAEQQTGFIKWLGLNVVASYGRPDTMTPKVVQELVDLGRQEEVTLVIENMQSGAEAGKGLAEELGVIRIVLSNFPGGYENTGTWEKAIDYNIDLILEASHQSG